MIEKKILELGQKVKIKSNHYWASDTTGIISVKPYQFEDDDWIDNYYRLVTTRKGKVISYWVKLDFAQLDADGDGPYQEGEFHSPALILID